MAAPKPAASASRTCAKRRLGGICSCEPCKPTTGMAVVCLPIAPPDQSAGSRPDSRSKEARSRPSAGRGRRGSRCRGRSRLPAPLCGHRSARGAGAQQADERRLAPTPGARVLPASKQAAHQRYGATRRLPLGFACRKRAPDDPDQLVGNAQRGLPAPAWCSCECRAASGEAPSGRRQPVRASSQWGDGSPC